MSVQSGPPLKLPPRWKRELRLLRRERFSYPRQTYLLWRFHRSVRRAEKGYDR